MESKLSEPSKVTVILSCCTDMLTSMAAGVKSIALYTFSAEYLDEWDRKTWLTAFLEEKLAGYVAKKTSGFTLAELEDLVKAGEEGSKERKSGKIEKVYEEAIDKRNSNFADAIGAPKVSSHKFQCHLNFCDLSDPECAMGWCRRIRRDEANCSREH